MAVTMTSRRLMLGALGAGLGVGAGAYMMGHRKAPPEVLLRARVTGGTRWQRWRFRRKAQRVERARKATLYWRKHLQSVKPAEREAFMPFARQSAGRFVRGVGKLGRYAHRKRISVRKGDVALT